MLRVKRLNLADGEPFAVVTVWCPAALGRRLSRDDVERQPFYELLDVELRGATQTIGADSAEPADAELLGVQVGSPVLRCRRVTTDTSGRPVLMSEHLFPAHRTEFVVEILLADPSHLADRAAARRLSVISRSGPETLVRGRAPDVHRWISNAAGNRSCSGPSGRRCIRPRGRA